MKVILKKILVYNNKWEDRCVWLEGWLNIITWYSKTWKSALLEIINYCFFSRVSNIPVWVIKEFAHIYVIILKVDNEYLVVWREENQANNCYVFNTDDIEEIDFLAFKDQVLNTTNAKNLLLKKFWIDIEEKYGTQSTWAISIRNFLPLLIQPQHLIANKYALFTGFDDFFRKKSIIDEFPYFFKIIQKDYLSNKRKLDRLNREIKKEDNDIKIKENQYANIRKKLQYEIQDFLETLGEQNIINDINKLLEIDLDKKFNEKFNSNIYNYSLNNKNIISNRNKRNDLNKKLQNINNALKTIDTTDEQINKHFNNVKSLEWVVLEENTHIDGEINCPLCSTSTNIINENFKLFDDSLKFLDKESQNLELYDLNIGEKKKVLLVEKNEIREEIKSINSYMKTLEDIDNKDYTIYEKLIVLKARINGQKDYLKELMALDRESIKDKNNSEITELEKKLKNYSLNKKKADLGRFLNEKINLICDRLDVEDQFKPSKLNFDIEKFTLFFDDNGEKIYLSEIWSWANILAWHISLFLGLLWASLKTDSFIPKFLIIDQPTQVYFPEKNKNITNESDIYEEWNKDKNIVDDFKNVENFYIVILEELDKMKIEFWYKPQVIIMDHADNLDLWESYNFIDYVRKNWREWNGFI